MCRKDLIINIVNYWHCFGIFRCHMIKNYLLITLRNFARNRTYTLINILGLSIGISSCLIIFLIVSNELSFDKFHSRYDRIYRVVLEAKTASGIDYGSTTPYPFTKAFRNDFPNVPLIVQLHMQEDVLMKVGVEKRRIHNVLFVDSLFFDVFDFKIVSGSPKVDNENIGRQPEQRW
jgi:putative ABC transport system permease protein